MGDLSWTTRLRLAQAIQFLTALHFFSSYQRYCCTVPVCPQEHARSLQLHITSILVAEACLRRKQPESCFRAMQSRLLSRTETAAGVGTQLQPPPLTPSTLFASFATTAPTLNKTKQTHARRAYCLLVAVICLRLLRGPAARCCSLCPCCRGRPLRRSRPSRHARYVAWPACRRTCSFPGGAVRQSHRACTYAGLSYAGLSFQPQQVPQRITRLYSPVHLLVLLRICSVAAFFLVDFPPERARPHGRFRPFFVESRWVPRPSPSFTSTPVEDRSPTSPL